MSGFSLCKSTLIRSSSIHSLCCSQISHFFTSSPSHLIFGTTKFISFIPRSRWTRLSCRSAFNKRNNGFSAFAVKKRRNGGAGLMGSDGFEDDGEDDDDDDDNEDWDVYDVAGGEDDDEGMFLPLGKVKKWLEKKPRGFGEGKVYDTSIEDKLLDEIEQSRQAQAANLNKLKNKPVKPEPKRDDQNIKGAADTQIGIRVRVSNLPKKKNVHRDLNSAFKGVSGIINIIPAVSGNKNTRDPICKGFAFVDFETDVDANRFVELFSGQRISFSKVQKQIKCRIMNASSNESSYEEECSDNGSDEQERPFFGPETESDAYFAVEDALSGSGAESDEPDYSVKELHEIKMEDNQQNLASSSVETPREPKQDSRAHSDSPKQLDKQREIQEESEINRALVSFQESIADAELDDDLGRVNMEDIEKNLKPVSAEKLRDVDDEAVRPIKGSTKSSDEVLLHRIKALEQKLLARGRLGGESDFDGTEQKRDRVKKRNDQRKKIPNKGQATKAPRLGMPGSSKRLKIKEKAVLTGVLSKYSAKAASTSNDGCSPVKT